MIDARVEKRPLLRPAIASPHAGSQAQKIVYIGTKTPFLSAVKRVEKLLHLADKRLVQGATKLAKDGQGRRRRREREDDEIAAIAEAVEEVKRDHKRQKRGRNGAEEGPLEEIVVKGTGKAIAKVLEVGLWFQQREEEYVVKLKTGSVSSIEDVSYEKDAPLAAAAATAGHNIGDAMEEDQTPSMPADHQRESDRETVEETRVRKVSVLEVYVSMR